MPNRWKTFPLLLALVLLLAASLTTVHLGAQVSSSVMAARSPERGPLPVAGGPASAGTMAPRMVVRYAERRAVSPPLRSLSEPALPETRYDALEIRRPASPRQGVDEPGQGRDPDLLLPSVEPGASEVPTPTLSFDGVSNADNVSQVGLWIMPPDTNGDVGPNHYVQMLNLVFGIWDKEGTQLVGPLRNRTLWSGLGGLCATSSRGDPIVLYDSMADRWLMSEFAFGSDGHGEPQGPFYECIAISQTPDPTGAWHLYAFLISETKMNDYPKFGVWPDGYYMSVNQFMEGSGSWAGVGVAALERARMLKGEPARMLYFDVGAVHPGYFGMLPSDLDGNNPPPTGSPNYFVEWDDAFWLGDPQDTLRIWEFRTDWSDPEASTFGLAGFAPNELVPTSNVDPNLCGYSRRCIPQPGTTQRVDALSDRLMHRLAYRRFGSHQSLVANHSVDVDGANHAGIHWFELRRLGGSWSLYQEGVHAPDEHDRWMGSIAMDQVGNMALGYSVSSEEVYPSVRYTGRQAEDPAGTMAQAEEQLAAGLGSQSSSDRWGDYSMMAVDPADDCTFWYTQQYYDEAGPDWQTRVGAFKFPSCKPREVNLAIAKTGHPEIAGPGQPVTYTLVYSNVGPTVASQVVISDVVPVELEQLRFESSRPVTATGAFSYTWLVGDMAPAETGAITLSARIRSEPVERYVLVNRAEIAAMGTDTDPDDNHAAAVTRVHPMRFYFPLARTGWLGQ